MNKFGYGIAFNLTLLATADKQELAYLDVPQKQRDLLLNKNYLLHETDKLPEGAEALYEATKTGPHLKEVFKHKPSLAASSQEKNIILAGHEMIHAARNEHHTSLKSWTNFIVNDASGGINMKKTARKNGGLLLGLGYIGALSFFGNLNAAVAMPAFAGTVIGGKKALGNAIDYYEESNKTYVYQEKLGAFLMRSASLTQVQADLQAAKDSQSFWQNAKDCLVKGYPGVEKRELIRLQQQENYLKNSSSLFSPQRVQKLHDETNRNLQRDTFSIKSVTYI